MFRKILSFKRGMFSWKKKKWKNWLDWEKSSLLGLPWWPSASDLVFPLQGLSVPSLVRDLRSHTPHGTAKKKKKTEKRLVHGLSWHYFYILFITFNLRKYWSIVDLQCVSFRCTVEWFSYTHIYPHLSGNLMLIGYWRILSRCPAAAEGGPWWLSSPYWLVRGSWSQALNLSPHPAAPCLQNHFPFGTRSLFSICVNPSVLYTSSFVSFFF